MARKRFETSDGYMLERQEDGTWTDGDLTFRADSDGLPQGDDGLPLMGEVCPHFIVTRRNGERVEVGAVIRPDIVLGPNGWQPGVVIPDRESRKQTDREDEYLCYHVNEGFGYLVPDTGDCADYPDDEGFSWEYVPGTV